MELERQIEATLLEFERDIALATTLKQRMAVRNSIVDKLVAFTRPEPITGEWLEENMFWHNPEMPNNEKTAKIINKHFGAE